MAETSAGTAATGRSVAVIGAGWAGLAAAVAATRGGHQVVLFESSRQLGGRARALEQHLPDGGRTTLDNGQHILVGAYVDTLSLMRCVGVDPALTLLRLPLTLRFPDGDGLALPDWPAPLDAVWGISRACGWGMADKLGLLGAALRWRRQGFSCGAATTVEQLCAGVPDRVVRDLIDPLCVSALNTPLGTASGQVFLTVLRDALFARGQGGWAGSNLLIPRVDLGGLLPHAAMAWLTSRGALVRTGQRVTQLAADGKGWRVDGELFDRVVLACTCGEAARLARQAAPAQTRWLTAAESLTHEAITTVYAQGRHVLSLPMLALRSGPGSPAQFAFDRGQLGGPRGLLAFVVSASRGDVATLQADVLAQAAALGWDGLVPVRTVTEKRATFACTAGQSRPGALLAPGLLVAGDYVDGPYPATIEGAVRSGLAAAAALN